MLLPPPPAPAATGGLTVDRLPTVPKLKGITTIAKFFSSRQPEAVLAALPAAPEAVLLAVLVLVLN